MNQLLTYSLTSGSQPEALPGSGRKPEMLRAADSARPRPARPGNVSGDCPGEGGTATGGRMPRSRSRYGGST